jgi:hypothetical protein
MSDYWPVQNLPGTTLNYVNDEPRDSDADQSMLRIDYQRSAKYLFYGRWNYDKDYYYLPNNTPKEGTVVATRPDQIMGGATQIFTPTLVNDVRFGWTRFVNNEETPYSFVNNINGNVLHIPGLNPLNAPSFWAVPGFSFNGYSGFGDNATIYRHTTTSGKLMTRLPGLMASTSLNLAESLNRSTTTRSASSKLAVFRLTENTPAIPRLAPPASATVSLISFSDWIRR